MRRSFNLMALLVCACGRARWEGSQTLSRTVQTSPDSVLAAANRALRGHGYTPILVDSILMVTQPHQVPVYTRNVSTAADSSAQWVLQIQVSPAFQATETRITIAAFVVPSSAMASNAASPSSRGVLVTSKDPQLFAEVQRVGNWIIAEAKHETDRD